MDAEEVRGEVAAARVGPVEDACGECGDTGWIVGDDGASRCECWWDRYLRELLCRASLPESYTGIGLDGFMVEGVDKSIMIAHARSVEYVAEYEPGARGLLFAGPPGVGKTHLAVGILVRLIREHRVRGYFADFHRLLAEIQSTYEGRADYTEEDVVQPAMMADVLVLDELGARRPTDWATDVLTRLLNERYLRRRTTIVTTNYDDSGHFDGTTLEGRIGARLRSRLREMCSTVRMRGRDFRALANRADYR